MGYRFRAGFPSKGGDAATIFSHLDEIKKQHSGALRPEDVVENAKSNVSPLHRYFDWDDTVASEKYRRLQAQNLITAVVIISDEQPSHATMRAFVTTKTDDSQSDVPCVRLREAISREDYRSILLNKAHDDLRAWRENYKEYKGFSDFFQEVDKVLDDFKPLQVSGAIKELTSWRKKYKALKELGGLVQAIDGILDSETAEMSQEIQVRNDEFLNDWIVGLCEAGWTPPEILAEINKENYNLTLDEIKRRMPPIVAEAV